MRRRFNFDAFDKLCSEALAEDHAMAEEGNYTANLEDEVFSGFISREDAEVVLEAFHRRISDLPPVFHSTE